MTFKSDKKYGFIIIVWLTIWMAIFGSAWGLEGVIRGAIVGFVAGIATAIPFLYSGWGESYEDESEEFEAS